MCCRMRAYGIPEAELVPYRELLAEARLKGFKEQALLPKGVGQFIMIFVG